MDGNIIFHKRYDHEESELGAIFEGDPHKEPIYDNVPSEELSEERKRIFIPALAAYYREAEQSALEFAETNRCDIDIIGHRVYNSIILYLPYGISLSEKGLYDFVGILKKCSTLKINTSERPEIVCAVELIFPLYGVSYG